MPRRAQQRAFPLSESGRLGLDVPALGNVAFGRLVVEFSVAMWARDEVLVGLHPRGRGGQGGEQGRGKRPSFFFGLRDGPICLKHGPKALGLLSPFGLVGSLARGGKDNGAFALLLISLLLLLLLLLSSERWTGVVKGGRYNLLLPPHDPLCALFLLRKRRRRSRRRRRRLLAPVP
jgi:hypothetical protein